MKKITEKINIITSDEYVIFVDAKIGSKECLPLFHGFPASIESSKELISRLQSYIERRELIEAVLDAELSDTDELYTPMEEARARVRDLKEIQGGDFGYVYLAINMSNGFFKIGKSINPLQRLKQLNKQFGENISFFNVIMCSDMNWAENYLHKRFEDRRLHNEWFAFLSDEVKWLMSIKRISRNIIEIEESGKSHDWQEMLSSGT